MTRASSPTDLLVRYQATRDPEALGALFDAMGPSLFRIACAVMGDASLAEDVLQETFLVLIESVDRFDAARSAEAWVVGILKRQAATARRRRARRPDASRAAPVSTSVTPAQVAEEREENERLNEALRSLPEPYRGVGLMRWKHGLEPAEIADIRGQAPGTIWSLLSRAKALLRRTLVSLPAVLVTSGSERGLAGVRSFIVNHAEQRLLPTGVGTGWGAAAGGGLLAKKSVLAMAVLVVGAALGGPLVTGWFAETPPLPPPGVVQQADAGRQRRTRPAPAANAEQVPVTASADTALPKAVDLDAADRERDLFGIVVDGSGSPIGGARLATVRHPWRDWSALSAGTWNVELPGPATISAGDGTFALRLDPGNRVRLDVTCQGYAPRSYRRRTAGERMRLELVRGASLIVTVKDADGRPVSGATVEARSLGTGWGAAPLYELSALTDKDGTATFRDLPPMNLSIDARGPNGVSSFGQQVVLPESGALSRTLVLKPSQTLRGVVTDAESGAPLAGARVGRGWVQRHFVETDIDGRYELTGWSRGLYQDLTVYADGYVWQKVVDPPTDHVDFKLARGDWVTGRIVNQSGTPIDGARVIAQGSVSPGRQQTFDAQATVSSADGTFALTGISREYAHTLVVSTDGHGRTLLDFVPADPAGEIALGDVALQPARRIAGVLLDPDDQPVPRGFVNLSGGNSDRARRLGGEVRPGVIAMSVTAHTDDLGRFLFSNVAPGTYALFHGDDTYDVVVGRTDVRDFILRTSVAATPPDDPPGPMASLQFRVLDGAGQPVEEAEVIVGRGNQQRAALVDGSGAASLVDLPAAPVTYRVASPRGEGEFFEQRGGPVTPNDQVIEVVLKRRGLLRGRVTGPDGEPLPRQGVRATPVDGGKPRYARADHEGRFELSAVAGRRYVLDLTGDRQVDRDDGQLISHRTPLRATTTPVLVPSNDIELRGRFPSSARELTVLVVDETNQGIPGLGVRVPGVPDQTTDAGGRARFVGLPAKDAHVIVLAPSENQDRGALLLPTTVRVMPNGQTLTLTCRKGVLLAGRVLRPDGKACAGAIVVAMPPDRSFRSGPIVTDAEGRFQIAIHADAACRVVAQWMSADKKRHSALVERVLHADGDIELRLQVGMPGEREGR